MRRRAARAAARWDPRRAPRRLSARRRGYRCPRCPTTSRSPRTATARCSCAARSGSSTRTATRDRRAARRSRSAAAASRGCGRSATARTSSCASGRRAAPSRPRGGLTPRGWSAASVDAPVRRGMPSSDGRVAGRGAAIARPRRRSRVAGAGARVGAGEGERERRGTARRGGRSDGGDAPRAGRTRLSPRPDAGGRLRPRRAAWCHTGLPRRCSPPAMAASPTRRRARALARARRGRRGAGAVPPVPKRRIPAELASRSRRALPTRWNGEGPRPAAADAETWHHRAPLRRAQGHARARGARAAGPQARARLSGFGWSRGSPAGGGDGPRHLESTSHPHPSGARRALCSFPPPPRGAPEDVRGERGLAARRGRRRGRPRRPPRAPRRPRRARRRTPSRRLVEPEPAQPGRVAAVGDRGRHLEQREVADDRAAQAPVQAAQRHQVDGRERRPPGMWSR